MLTSMTGFGKGSAALGEGELTVEIRTVNHRFIDFSIRTPRPLSGFDNDIEKMARRKITRGHVYITVAFDREFEAENFTLNKPFLRKTFKEISAFASREGIPGDVEIGTLLSLPEAFTSKVETMSEKKLKAALRKAMKEALERCAAMRGREGEALKADIAKHLQAIGRITASVEKKAPGALEMSLERVRKRLGQIMEPAGIDESRWATEAALLADKADFSEELVRLKSHLEQFSKVLDDGGEVAKKLTFLLQEIHREATTMGNKATDSGIIRDCLNIKGKVEKIREQVQNLE